MPYIRRRRNLSHYLTQLAVGMNYIDGRRGIHDELAVSNCTTVLWIWNSTHVVRSVAIALDRGITGWANAHVICRLEWHRIRSYLVSNILHFHMLNGVKLCGEMKTSSKSMQMYTMCHSIRHTQTFSIGKKGVTRSLYRMIGFHHVECLLWMCWIDCVSFVDDIVHSHAPRQCVHDNIVLIDLIINFSATHTYSASVCVNGNQMQIQ